jgi:cyclophilin family peptidyl-prolyl cis-trans isomerase
MKAIGLTLTLLMIASSFAGCTVPETIDEGGIIVPEEADWGNSTRVIMSVTWTDSSNISQAGNIALDICSKHAPMHAESFILHSENGAYDNAIFHRVMDEFMIQGGDFENYDGTGGYAAKYFGVGTEADQSSWNIPGEFDSRLTHSEGILSMARSSNSDSAGSQFFIVDKYTTANWLDGDYTIFGRTADANSLDVVNEISLVNTSSGNRPVHDVTIIATTNEAISGDTVARACQFVE